MTKKWCGKRFAYHCADPLTSLSILPYCTAGSALPPLLLSAWRGSPSRLSDHFMQGSLRLLASNSLLGSVPSHKRGCRQPFAVARNSSVQCQRQVEPESQQQQHRHVSATRRQMLFGSSAGLIASICPCCAQLAQASESSQFSYSGDTGPSSWPGTCAAGRLQSPINIPLAQHFAENVASGNGDQQGLNRFGDVQFAYGNQAGATVQNTGHGTMQVNPAKGNTCRVGDRDLELVQWHFHTPSEHAFDGGRKAMEAHLVHKDTESGLLSVLAVLFQEGEAQPNPALQFALELAPPAPGQLEDAGQRNMSLDHLLPEHGGNDHRPYIHYVGSLTTPPCSEEVQWFVFATTVKVPSSQVHQFQQYTEKAFPGLHENSRPLQPLGNRLLEYNEFL